VDNLDRENLLQYNTKKLNNRVPLVITYSKALPNIHEILKKNMKILYNCFALIPRPYGIAIFTEFG
jgi:Na+/phosphate symporter